MNGTGLRLFLRRDCELCEALYATLLAEPRIASLAIEVIDIDEMTDWRPAYHFRIPVLTRGDQELWAGPVDEDSRQHLIDSVLSS